MTDRLLKAVFDNNIDIIEEEVIFHILKEDVTCLWCNSLIQQASKKDIIRLQPFTLHGFCSICSCRKYISFVDRVCEDCFSRVYKVFLGEKVQAFLEICS